MRILSFLITLYLLALMACSRSTEQPNVLFILTDQWRGSAFGYAGDPNVQTPELDRFAEEAIRFTNAVSVCPVCTPYRASLLTGRYPTSTGMFLNDAYLPPDEISLAEVFKEKGYQTAYIGKWHLDGHGRLDFTPPERRQGFDYWKALECSHDYFRMPYYEGTSDQIRYWEGYSPTAICQDAEDYLTRHANDPDPFFLFVSVATPHFPHHTAPQEFKDKYQEDRLIVPPNVPEIWHEQARKEMLGYYAHCTATDEAIGRLLNRVRELDLLKNSLIVFTSDHGESLGAQGVRITQKQVPWLESAGVPLLIHHPGSKSSGVLNMAVTTPDLSATVLDLAGIKVPEQFEGQSFAKNIKLLKDDPEKPALYMSVVSFAAVKPDMKKEYRAIKTARYTYVEDVEGVWLLYDDQNDPFQMNNLAGLPDYQDVMTQLKKQLDTELNRIGDDFQPGTSYLDAWGYDVTEGGYIRYLPHNQKPQMPERKQQE